MDRRAFLKVGGAATFASAVGVGAWHELFSMFERKDPKTGWYFKGPITKKMMVQREQYEFMEYLNLLNRKVSGV